MRLQVKDIMSTAVFTAKPESSVGAIREVMKKKGIHAVPITEFNKLPTHTETKIRGIVTATDLCCEIDNNRTLSDIMDPTIVHVIPETTSVKSAAKMMLKHDVHHIVVMNNGQIIGMISSLDFVKIVAEHNLNDIPEKIL